MLLAIIAIILVVGSTTAEARLRHHRNAQVVDALGVLVIAQASSSSLPSSTTLAISTDANTADNLPTVTSFSATTPSSPASSSSCTPRSICVDGITCGKRYGGCYDANYCDGNTTPYPIPTCNSSPADGLTSNNVNNTPQRLNKEDDSDDIAAEVIVKNLVDASVQDD